MGATFCCTANSGSSSATCPHKSISCSSTTRSKKTKLPRKKVESEFETWETELDARTPPLPYGCFKMSGPNRVSRKTMDPRKVTKRSNNHYAERPPTTEFEAIADIIVFHKSDGTARESMVMLDHRRMNTRSATMEVQQPKPDINDTNEEAKAMGTIEEKEKTTGDLVANWKRRRKGSKSSSKTSGSIDKDEIFSKETSAGSKGACSSSGSTSSRSSVSNNDEGRDSHLMDDDHSPTSNVDETSVPVPEIKALILKQCIQRHHHFRRLAAATSSGSDRINGSRYDGPMRLHSDAASIAFQLARSGSRVSMLRRISDRWWNIVNETNRTLLMEATIYGHSALVEDFLVAKADVNARDDDGNSALHLAAARGHKEIIKLLVKNGAQRFAKNKRGFRAMDGADGALELRVKIPLRRPATIERLPPRKYHR